MEGLDEQIQIKQEYGLVMKPSVSYYLLLIWIDKGLIKKEDVIKFDKSFVKVPIV